ncbi:MAG: helix-turn-helix transcriptional regulator [Acetobacteraceae bacterium]|nr:helix-turn-helix transcriptional regulator [Acetobacteraceae bacterium]
MPRAAFTASDFVAAAREIARAGGPDAVTVAAVSQRLKAPTGSFYHRFVSRDALAGELWLSLVLAFQEGFRAAADAGDWLGAALHVPAWSRANPGDARLLLAHRREDFAQGAEWPEDFKRRVRDQAAAVQDHFTRFARDALGGVDAERLRRAQFALADAPIAAVRPHLAAGESPPPVVDDLVRETFLAVAGPGARRPGPAPA